MTTPEPESQLDVTPYPITDRETLMSAFFTMNDNGWKGKIVYGTPTVNGLPVITRTSALPDAYSAVLEKAGETVNIQIGDELMSIGNGVLMTREKFQQLFG
jgi:hypothetical protein